DIERSEALKRAQPLLHEGTLHIAHYQVRNRGTVGGSLAHADPAAELPGLAVACGAGIEIVGPSGKRTVAADAFFIGPLETALEADEIITGLSFPPWPAARRWGFEEFARRPGDLALAGIALHHDPDEAGRARNAHVVVIGATDRPRRLAEAEAII